MLHPFISSTIGFTYKKLLKPFFFARDPEDVHDRMTRLGEFLGRHAWSRAVTRRLFCYRHPALEQTISSIRFENPIGLSAGFDKDAKLLQILPAVGFGFMEAGSVTLHPYAGNPRPRLARLPQSQALMVYYGLKNEGVRKIIQRIQSYPPSPTSARAFPLGVSIAKTNSLATCEMRAGVEDYSACCAELLRQQVGNFYTINISCPNTFGGEPFTSPEKLDALLEAIFTLRPQKPIFIKMPINMEWGQFRVLLDVILRYSVRGVVIGNLNKNHADPAVRDPLPAGMKGGISGKPTWILSNELISRTYRYCGDRLIIIGVGGVFSARDAYEKIKRGASLVQLITGMIYEGPQLVGQINRGLVRLLRADGLQNISEAMGRYHRS